MPATRRAQILVSPEDYRRLEKIARQRGVSVAELFRTAVQEKYLAPAPPVADLARLICEMNLPIQDDWKSIEQVIEERRDEGFPR